ncbi:MAG: transporter [Opitutaceae bacterium]|jgi:hypothetical protein|nr:transporter [Opitutaceae bacterium]
MSKISALSFLLTLALGLTTSVASGRPDSHAPIGVMGDHTHLRGEWMASYRYMTMSMGPNYSGSSSLTPSDVHAGFPVSPIGMDMGMQMVGLMYAPSDQVTLMGMLNHTEISMDHIVRNGRTFTTRTSGIGDTGLGALWSIQKTDSHQVHLNLGITLPTGDLDVRDATPMGPNSLLPYAMRLGSGTYDLKPGITWTFLGEGWSAGAQGIATVRLNDNKYNYTLGDRVDLTAWVSYSIHPSVSISARVSYADWQNIDGADTRLNPMMVPTARTDLRSGSETTAHLGLNWEIPTGTFEGHRLAVEYGSVIERSLTGPQLGTDDVITMVWQWAF